MATMIPSTMTTTKDRVPESVYSSVCDEFKDWPEPEASLVRKYFDQHKKRLIDGDYKCFSELQVLLDTPLWTTPDFGSSSAGGTFITWMGMFNDYFVDLKVERDYKQAQDFHRALLDNGELEKFLDALQAAREAVRIVDEKGLLHTDEHVHLNMLDGVWRSWKKSQSK